MSLRDVSWQKIARFPFLERNKEIFRKFNFTIDNIIKDFDKVLPNAITNLRLILQNIDDFSEKKIQEDLIEALSYPVQNGIVAYLHDKWFVNRYAEAFSRRTRKFIELEKNELVILKEWDVKIKEDANGKDLYKMDVFDFLSFATKIRASDLKSGTDFQQFSKRFKLSNNILDGGWVKNLTRNDISSLITAALREHVYNKVHELFEHLQENKLPKKIMEDAESLKDIILELKQERKIGEFYTGTVYNDAFPSCINNAHVQLLAGKNLDHQERLVFEFFSLNIGMTAEELLNLFAHSPDFRQDLTSYMVDHAERKQYKSYGCKKIKSFGLCKINRKNDPYQWCTDGKIKNPLSFFSRMASWLENRVIPTMLCFPFVFAQKKFVKEPKNVKPNDIPFSRRMLLNYLKRTTKLKRKK